MTARGPARRVSAHRLGVVLAALALALAGLVPGAVAPAGVQAATPALTVVGAATYDVQPDQRTVAVAVDLTATSHRADTVTKAYYYTGTYLALLPGATSLKVSATGSTPAVSVVKRDATATLVKITFGRELGYGQSIKLHLTFALVDKGGAPDRAVRVTSTLVAFSLWAYGTAATPGSTVTLRIPAGYTVTLGRGPIAGPTTAADGTQVWTTAKLADPLSWILDVTADRPGAYVETDRSVQVGPTTARLVILSWPDDPGWRQRVGDLVTAGLPVLADEIGVPWRIDGPLTVEETLLRTTGGYAGLFDPGSRRLQISFLAAPGVILHESAHAWFNGELIADRWEAEAFASYYAELAADQLKVRIVSPELTKAQAASHVIPLNAWGAIGTEDQATESYAYAATLALARLIGERAGLDGLRRVWAAVAAGDAAYQPPTGGPEQAASVPDWRGLLDLLEDLTGKRYDDLWRDWVARPEDVALLDRRVTARADYAGTVQLAGDWILPRAIRDAMRAWRFDDAAALDAAARSVLKQRAAVEAAAAGVGLTPPEALRVAFEGDRGFPAAAAEADAELTAIHAIAAAVAAGADRPPAGVLEWLGRLGVDPVGEVARARASFESGDADAAIAAAQAASLDATTAGDVGRARLVSLGLLGMALLVAASILTSRRVRHRRDHAGPG